MSFERVRPVLTMTTGVLAAVALACGGKPERKPAAKPVAPAVTAVASPSASSDPAPAAPTSSPAATPESAAAAPPAASPVTSPAASPVAEAPAATPASTPSESKPEAAPAPEAGAPPATTPKPAARKPKAVAPAAASDPAAPGTGKGKPATNASGFPRKIRLDDPAFRGGKFEGGVRSLFSNKAMVLPLDLPAGKYKVTVNATTNAVLNGEPARYTLEVGSAVSGPLDSSLEGLKQEFVFEKPEGPVKLKLSLVNDKTGVDTASQKRVDLNLYVRAISLDKAE